VVQGVIDRRILANYQVDAEVLARVVPAPFRPKLVNGVGIAGVCLIRLKHIRPQFLPGNFGLRSENAAHRIAVTWEAAGQTREGVYIPRRDTTSQLNTLVGGRLFPGVHHRARFEVDEGDGHYHVELTSADGRTHVRVDGQVSDDLSPNSVFGSLEEASRFFEAGAVGYSATGRASVYDGLELRSRGWQVTPLAVERIESSFFDDEAVYPRGSVRFDCALLMRGIEHEWRGLETLCA
jgi:hypothetical protein